jgi:PAS domain S-box-containing protein
MDYGAIFRASPDGILVVDEEGRIQEANPMAAQLFGYALEELIGCGVDSLVPDSVRPGHAAHRRAYVARPNPRPMGIGLELSARRRDGSEFPVEISLSPYRNRDRTLVIATVRDVTQRRQLRDLGVAALRASETERKRVARELHDDTAQRLAALLIRLRVIERDTSNEHASSLLKAFRDELAAAAEGVRRIARGLRPPELEDAGLVAALRAHARTLREGIGLMVELDADPVDDLLNSDRRLVLYRVIQEALANVSRHSGVTTAHVRVQRGDGAIVVTVADQGRGFTEGRQSTLGGGLGLVGMQERAAGVGGRVQIESAEGVGTRVTITLPVPPVGSNSSVKEV